MRPVRSFSIIGVNLFCIVTSTYSKELAKVVNTPKALQLEVRIKQLSQEQESLSKTYFGLRDDFNRLLKEAKEKNDRSLYNKFSKENRPEYNSLKIRKDSISELFAKTRTAHSKEITNTKESQEVLKKMQEEIKAGETGRNSASYILRDYRKSLRDAALAKISKIDKKTFREELTCITK
ncbi:MAG: hypothetical protein EOO43_22150 [Flavobacterium sp.]|nr:MAG: hypothetical protein EOO43_22150 [Flavobacterium sp.]